MNYRKIWKNHYGPIPKDKNGRSYEIHHKDGNHKNNEISNLSLLTIEEHYDIHYSQGDWGACVCIAKRMKLSPEYISDIQKGKKRPGIGGNKKGYIPWNKGKKIHSEKQKKIWSEKRKGKVHSKKFEEKNIKLLLEKFINTPIESQLKQKNGKYLSHERKFANENAKLFGMTNTNILKIISGKTIVWKHLFDQIVNSKF